MTSTRAHRAERRPARRALPLLVGGTVAAVGLAVTGVAVFAGLNATAGNTSAESVSSGTLKLTTAAATGSAGFSSTLSNLAPGDSVNRYVDLTNGGSLDGQGLTLSAADATSTKLTSDATNGLHVTVTQCSGGTWTVSTAVCSGSTSTLASNVAVASLISTPASLLSGAVAQGAVLHLQVSTSLPNQTETTTNGNLPAGTIQGLTANLTWTFSEAQRTGTTTNV